MKVKLNVLERITMIGLLPKEENYLTYKMITELKMDLSFSDAEWKKYGLEVLPNGRTAWKNGKPVKEIEIPDVIMVMVKAKLVSLETAKKINGDNVSLYERFILDKTKTTFKRKIVKQVTKK